MKENFIDIGFIILKKGFSQDPVFTQFYVIPLKQLILDSLQIPGIQRQVLFTVCGQN